jgi:predicted aspartyl protease
VIALVLALVLALGDAPAGSPTPSGVPLDEAAILKHVHEAAGTRPKAERIIASFSDSGLQGTRTTLRSGDDRRETETVGPFTTASGTYHGQNWYQNANGQTVLSQPEGGHAAPDPTTTTVTPVTTPVNGHVIAELNKRGQGTREYVDSATWRIVRRDYISAADTTVYVYDDFRTTAGYTQAWHWTSRDGHPENDGEYRIQSIDTTTVTDADLAIPPSRRNLVEFPPGVTSVKLPARENRAKFLVRVNIGSRGLDLELDTGADGIVLDDDVVKELGLKTYGAYSSAANAGRFKGTSTIVPEMKVGTLTMRDVAVQTIPHVGDDSPGEYKAVGLLGFDFIASLVLELDYERGEVTAIDPDAFVPPTDPLTNAVTVRLGSGVPLTDVSVNGALGERFMVDTGAAGGMMIFDYFARRHPEALVDAGHGYAGPAQTFLGVGGEFEARPLQLSSVRLGRVNFADFVAYVVASSKSYGFHADGLIGAGFLELYTVYTDYQNSMLNFVPNALGRSSMKK